MGTCFFDDIHENFLRAALGRSLVRPAVERMDTTNPCYIISALTPEARNGEIYKNKLIFLTSFFVFTLRMVAFLVRQNVFLFVPNLIFSGNLHFSMSKGIDSKLRNAIDELWVAPLLEQGYLTKLFDQLEIRLASEFPTKNQFFTSSNEYVASNTYVRDVAFNDFKAFFYLHLLLLLFFSAGQTAFLLTKLVLRMNRNIRLSKRRILNWTTFCRTLFCRSH